MVLASSQIKKGVTLLDVSKDHSQVFTRFLYHVYYKNDYHREEEVDIVLKEMKKRGIQLIAYDWSHGGARESFFHCKWEQSKKSIMAILGLKRR